MGDTYNNHFLDNVSELSAVDIVDLRGSQQPDVDLRGSQPPEVDQRSTEKPEIELMTLKRLAQRVVDLRRAKQPDQRIDDSTSTQLGKTHINTGYIPCFNTKMGL